LIQIYVSWHQNLYQSHPHLLGKKTCQWGHDHHSANVKTPPQRIYRILDALWQNDLRRSRATYLSLNSQTFVTSLKLSHHAMNEEQHSSLWIIIFVIAVAVLVMGVNSTVKDRDAAAAKSQISTPAPNPSPPTKALAPAPGEEIQLKARQKTMRHTVECLDRKFNQIDFQFRTRLQLDEIDIAGRQVLQNANLELEYQNAAREYASRVPIDEPGPQYMAEMRHRVPRILEVNDGVSTVFTSTTPAQVFEVPDEIDENTTNVDFWSVENRDEGRDGLGWRNPLPLGQQIPNWRRNVQGLASDRHSAPS
jgi:hypothetical protein